MSTEFFARIGNKVYGPVDGAKLKKLAAAGKLTRDHAISKDGKTGWVPAGNVKGLFPPAELLPAVTERPHPIETVVPREPIAIARPVFEAPSPIAPPVSQPAVVVVQAPQQPQQQIVQQTTVVVNAEKRGNTCATLAAGLGIMSLIAAFVPVLGLIVIPAASLTLLLALFGFILALARGGTGLVGSLGGALLAIIAIPIALASTVTGVGGAIQAVDEARQQARQSTVKPAPTAVESVVPVPNAAEPEGSATLTPPEKHESEPSTPRPDPSTNEEPDEPSTPSPAPVVDVEPEQPMDPEPITPQQPEWTIAPAPQQIGDARVAVVSATIGKVPLKDFSDESTKSADDLLIVRLKVENLSTSRKMNYHGFNPDFSLGDDVARLRDNYDNLYKRIGFGASTVVGEIESDSIYPGKSLDDVLVFEVPVKNAEYVRLELPAANLGEKGSFRFEIPREMIGQQTDSNAQLAEIAKEIRRDVARLDAEQQRILRRRPTAVQQAGIDAFAAIQEEYHRRSEADEAEAVIWLRDQIKGKSIRDLAPKE